MRLFVKAKPGAAVELVEKIDDTHYIVSVKEPPVAGRANQAIIKALGAHFGVPASSVSIISGRTSRAKIISLPSGSNSRE